MSEIDVFFETIKNNNHKKLNDIIKTGFDINTTKIFNEEKYTPMCWACINNSHKCINILLESGANATKSYLKDEFIMIIEKGIEKKMKYPNYPIFMTAKYGYLNCYYALSDNIWKLGNIMVLFIYLKLLLISCVNNHEKYFEKISGIIFCEEDTKKILNNVLYYDRENCLNALLINKKSHTKNSSMWSFKNYEIILYALNHNSIKCLKYLKLKKIKISKSNALLINIFIARGKITSKMFLNHIYFFSDFIISDYCNDQYIYIFKFLLEIGFKLTPHCLKEACLNGNSECIHIIVNNGLNINTICYLHGINYSCALMCACISKNKQCISTVLELGFDLKYSSEKFHSHYIYITLPALLIKNKDFYHFKKILRKMDLDIVLNTFVDFSIIKYDVSTQYSFGISYLALACYYQYMDFITYLVELGFDINGNSKLSENINSLPIYHACKNNNNKLTDYLLKNGAKIMEYYHKDLVLCAIENHNEYFLSKLLMRGADLNDDFKGQQFIKTVVKNTSIKIRIEILKIINYDKPTCPLTKFFFINKGLRSYLGKKITLFCGIPKLKEYIPENNSFDYSRYHYTENISDSEDSSRNDDFNYTYDSCDDNRW